MWCDVEMVCDVKGGGVMQRSDVAWYLVMWCGNIFWCDQQNIYT